MKATIRKYATKLRNIKSEIEKEQETAAKHQAALSASKTKIKHLRSEQSEIEAAAADDGVSVSELHDALEGDDK